MGKRANNQAAGKATKTPKLDPTFAPVADVIKNAGHLPERCRSMLIDLLPFSLALAADTRSESQTAVVGMMEEAFMTVKSEMEAEVTSQMEKKQSTETAIADRGRVVEEGGNAVSNQKEITDAAKSALDDATKAMDESQQALTEKQNAQKSGDENLTTTRANKNSLEVVFKEHFQTPMEKSEAPNYGALEPFLHQLDIEQSLLTALPGTCEKDKSNRGNFDEVVLTEFEKAMAAKIASLNAVIEAETPACVERENEVKSAEMELNAKKEEHKLADEAWASAKKELAEREAAVEQEQEAVKDFQRQLESAIEMHKNTLANVKWFEDGPLADFLRFKAKTATPVEAAPAGA
jgi:hypothetical protein|mmetsp:Transcript_17398/g.28215  ORF Transcript_17398/g.28215 Transcript_17398/m.28215 type:complete len:349 (-) Transcript_17398:168-1214(-)